ncbi:MAG: thioredoxin-like protein [Amycolatopsis sp.]|jgi:Fe-S cluster biogenesis protein NfuA|uniref:NifU family protein n=1 Tax=Amycolatopsis sp. TaxID=37632 RepID=UPI00260FD104|nr:NifU family protein [Amycolatopsis sp.]MCU1686739.1 thioredoxin-like protein [Amycolatopsis sp.]
MAQPDMVQSEEAPPPDVAMIGERIEQILSELEATAERSIVEKTEDLVHTLLEFYGTGLTRIVDLIRETVGGEHLLEMLATDDLVKGLLVLHDLHPKTVLERVTEALDKVRPYLGSHAGDVDLIGVDEDGVLRLQLKGTCDGCPSSTVTVKYAIEKAIHAAAPEISDIDVAGVVEETPAATGPGGRPLLPLQAIECPVPEDAL